MNHDPMSSADAADSAEMTDAARSKLTGSDDSILEIVRAANPVPLDEARPAVWDGADNLFARITSRPGGFEPYVAPESKREPTSRRDRLPLLAAVATALVLLTGAVALLAPGSGQPALAAVTSAADQTAGATSGRVITTLTAVGHDGADAENLGGTLSAAFNGENVSVAVDLDSTPSGMSAGEVAKIEAVESRLVDGQVFITNDGRQWISLEAPEFIQSALVQFTDLRSILAQVNELLEVSEIGSTSIDGLAVTHYQSNIDLAEQSLAESGWFPGMDGPLGQAIDIEAEGLVTVDLFVDDDGLMRRIQVSGQAEPTDVGVDASVDFSVVTDFVDLGSDIVIETPDPALVRPLEGFELDE
ncbi:MAG: hypothetical protein OER95_07590 [Acidimicrobiia bacterium]|nr:hypothetical protein [Acidimicrobiia bacterium]